MASETIRTARAAEGKFTQLANAMLFDNRLGMDTRCLISMMTALPPGSKFNVQALMKRTGRGRDAIGRMLREAEDNGYFVRTRHQDEQGYWHWDQVISDGPIEDQPYDGNPAHGATCGNCGSSQVAPSTGNPSDGKAVDKRSNTQTSKHVRRRTRASGVRVLGEVQLEVPASTPRRNAREVS